MTQATDNARGQGRFTVQLPCEVHTAPGPVVHGVVCDLSLIGAFVASDQRPSFGTEVTLLLRIPHTIELRIPAAVRWSRGDGFGLQFVTLGVRETYELSAFLRGLMLARRDSAPPRSGVVRRAADKAVGDS